MTKWVVETCYKCSEPFCMSEETQTTLKRSCATFYCPFGHPQAYISKEKQNEIDVIRRERDRLKQETARLADEARMIWKTVEDQRQQKEAANRSARAYRGQVTRLKNRAAAGLCPCCNRSFANLWMHMEDKHPGFKAEEVTPDGVTVQ